MSGELIDHKELKRREKKEVEKREQELDDIRLLLGTPHGKRFLFRLIAHCKVFETAYSDNSNRAFYFIGKQDVGRFLQAELNEVDGRSMIELIEYNNSLGGN